MQSMLTQRNSGVDLARTLAIFGVVLVHTTGIGFGRFGVQLFFLISGYLLADFQKYESASSFLFRRAARLFPLYVLVLFYFSFTKSISIDFFNLLLFANIYWNFPQVPGGWSISSEWLFSLFLVVLGWQTRLKIWFWIVLSIVAQVISGLYVYSLGGADSVENSSSYVFLTWLNTTNPLINISFFMIGIAVKREFVPLLTSKLQLIALSLICVCVDLAIGHAMVIWNLGIYSIFLLCLTSEIGDYSKRIVSFIGKRTYGIFFSHFILLEPVSNLVSNHFETISFVRNFCFFILVFAISVFCGWITWGIVESPCLKVSKILHAKLRIN